MYGITLIDRQAAFNTRNARAWEDNFLELRLATLLSLPIPPRDYIAPKNAEVVRGVGQSLPFLWGTAVVLRQLTLSRLYVGFRY